MPSAFSNQTQFGITPLINALKDLIPPNLTDDEIKHKINTGYQWLLNLFAKYNYRPISPLYRLALLAFVQDGDHIPAEGFTDEQMLAAMTQAYLLVLNMRSRFSIDIKMTLDPSLDQISTWLKASSQTDALERIYPDTLISVFTERSPWNRIWEALVGSNVATMRETLQADAKEFHRQLSSPDQWKSAKESMTTNVRQILGDFAGYNAQQISRLLWTHPALLTSKVSKEHRESFVSTLIATELQQTVYPTSSINYGILHLYQSLNIDEKPRQEQPIANNPTSSSRPPPSVDTTKTA